MAKYSKEIATILASEAFCKISNSDTIKIIELNAAIALLIKTNIPFDVFFSPGTRRDSPSITLEIYINPNSRIKFSITLE